MWTINGKLIGRTHVEVQVYCLCYTAAPEGVYVNVLVGGLANGNVRLVCSLFSVVAFNETYIDRWIDLYYQGLIEP